MPHAHDVIVVGAGPAGAVCAAELARHGWHVLVLERARQPRFKTCGGALVGRALARLPAEVGEVIHEQCHRADLHLEDAELAWRIERSTPLARIAVRSELDAWLASAAVRQGADLEEACEVTGLERRGDRIELQTTRGARSARVVVAADGALGSVAELAGFPRLTRLAAAVALTHEVPASDMERFRNRVRFDLGVPLHGYAWVFPRQNQLLVGALSMSPHAAGLGQTLVDYAAMLRIASLPADRSSSFVIPVAPRPGPLARDGLLLVGDAAGLADPVSGEGISFALWSGQLAAQALVQERARPARSCRLYRRLLRRGPLRELRIARQLAPWLHGSARRRAWLLNKAGPGLAEAFLGVMSGQTSFRKLLYSPDAWGRLLRKLAAR